MSRAPTAAARQAEPPPPDLPTWFAVADQFPADTVVLTTTDPQRDAEGVPGRWYERRQFGNGRWARYARWVDPATMRELDPQPTHWRPDPTRGLFPSVGA
jgi:hypothetical protein